jgi:hypothetical protein
LIAEQLAQDALARAMLTYLPAGYERIELEFSAAGPVSQASIWATLTDGTEKSFPDLTDIVRAAETQLKRVTDAVGRTGLEPVTDGL